MFVLALSVSLVSRRIESVRTDQKDEADTSISRSLPSNDSSLGESAVAASLSSGAGLASYIYQGLGGQPKTTSSVTTSTYTSYLNSTLLAPQTAKGLLSGNNETLQRLTTAPSSTSSVYVPLCPTAGTASSDLFCLAASSFWSTIPGGITDVYTTCAGIPRASGPWMTGSAWKLLVHTTSQQLYTSGATFNPTHQSVTRPARARALCESDCEVVAVLVSTRSVQGCDGGCALLGSWSPAT